MSLATIGQRDPLAAFAIGRTLPLEGGLVDNPHDPGGVTSHGVSLRFALAEIKADPTLVTWLDIDHDGDVDRQDIMGLTLDEAADVYFNVIWQPYWYRRLAPALVAWKCFDIGVNTGPKRAALILQKSLCAVGANVAVDAVVGPKTVDAVQRQAKADQGTALLAAIRKKQADFYRQTAATDPNLAGFLSGWLNRAAA